MMYNKRLYTLSEAAYYLGVSTTTLRKWEDLGKIVSIKKPGSEQKFFLEEQIRKMLWKIDNRILTSRTSIR